MCARVIKLGAPALAGQRDFRPGSLLLEVIVGAALLATLLVIINQIVVRLHSQTAGIDQQFIAQQTLENLLEALQSHPWGDLESTAIGDLKIPASVRSKLPRARIAGEVVPVSDPVAAKRITLRIEWRNVAGTEPDVLAATSPVSAPPVSAPLAATSLVSAPLAVTPQESRPGVMTTRTLTTWVYQRLEDDR